MTRIKKLGRLARVAVFCLLLLTGSGQSLVKHSGLLRLAPEQ